MIEQERAQIVNIWSLIPDSWRRDTRISEIGINCFSSSIRNGSEQQKFAMSAVLAFKNILPDPWLIGFSIASEDRNVDQLDMVWVHDGDQPKIYSISSKTAVPAGQYIYVIAPIFTIDSSRNQTTFIRITEFIRGLLTVLFGHTAMHEWSHWYSLDPDEPEHVILATKVAEAHIPPDLWRIFESKSLEALQNAIATGYPEPARSKAETALQFIGRAVNELDYTIRFSHVWIAFEIAAGGHHAARKFLNELSPAFKAEAKRLFDLRNALFHQGIQPEVDQNDERFLIACVFAIILREFEIEDAGFQRLCSSARPTCWAPA